MVMFSMDWDKVYPEDLITVLVTVDVRRLGVKEGVFALLVVNVAVD